MGVALPLRAGARGRGRWPRGGRLVAAPHAAALVAGHRGPGRGGRVGRGPVRRPVAIPDACRARLRGHHDLRGRYLAFRRNCGRPESATAPASIGDRRGYPVGAVVDTSAPARESQAGTPAEAWPDIAKAIGLAGAEVMSATVDVWGWRAPVPAGTWSDD